MARTFPLNLDGPFQQLVGVECKAAYEPDLGTTSTLLHVLKKAIKVLGGNDFYDIFGRWGTSRNMGFAGRRGAVGSRRMIRFTIGKRSLSKASFDSAELIAGFQFAAIILGLVPVDYRMAIRPPQKEIRAQREHNRISLDLGFNARAFRRGRQAEVQRMPENYRVSLSHHVAGHGMNHFSLHQECNGV